MPRFCANLDFLFTERPFFDRFDAAARAGFDAVEILFPYIHAEADLAAALADAGLPLALINMPVPDWGSGGRGSAAVPGREAQFAGHFAQGCDLARRLGAGRLHVLSGCAAGAEAEATFLTNMTAALNRAGPQQLTIEPLNPQDMPGYFLNDFDQAVRLIDRLSAGNLGLQFDAYHAHRIAGDAPAVWARIGDRVTHIQVAGWPGRHEPAGGMDFPTFFATLDRSGYLGVVSCEYHPETTTEAGLGWMRRSTQEGSAT